jgi:hypothetical protein
MGRICHGEQALMLAALYKPRRMQMFSLQQLRQLRKKFVNRFAQQALMIPDPAQKHDRDQSHT